MARIWSDRQLERATTPQAKDIRGKAFLSVVNRLLGDRPLPGPHMRDPETCPAEVLPALVAEYSMEEFIEPGLPEHVVRRILRNRWALQAGEGYDTGVRLGLSLLGMTAVIRHWWQAEPKRSPNTQDLTFYIGEQLFANDQTFFGEREKKAALRMIEATKRWSQESTIYVGAAFRPRPVQSAMRICGLSVCRARMQLAQRGPRLPLVSGVAQTTHAVTIKRLKLSIGVAPHAV